MGGSSYSEVLPAQPAEPVVDAFKPYRIKGVLRARPYVPGEDMTGIDTDDNTEFEGGFIVKDDSVPDYMWFIDKENFEKNLEEIK